MSNRILPFLSMMGVWLFIAISGAITLFIGYWFSDVLYAAGLWPLGAILRIGLFFELIGWAGMVLIIPFVALWTLIFGASD